ncbi:unnamed protein product, partial [Mesorhabditis spiculigera]
MSDHWCPVCHTGFPSQYERWIHEATIEHQSQEKHNMKQWSCLLCPFSCSGKGQYQKHLNGKEHQAKVAEYHRKSGCRTPPDPPQHRINVKWPRNDDTIFYSDNGRSAYASNFGPSMERRDFDFRRQTPIQPIEDQQMPARRPPPYRQRDFSDTASMPWHNPRAQQRYFKAPSSGFSDTKLPSDFDPSRPPPIPQPSVVLHPTLSSSSTLPSTSVLQPMAASTSKLQSEDRPSTSGSVGKKNKAPPNGPFTQKGAKKFSQPIASTSTAAAGKKTTAKLATPMKKKPGAVKRSGLPARSTGDLVRQFEAKGRRADVQANLEKRQNQERQNLWVLNRQPSASATTVGTIAEPLRDILHNADSNKIGKGESVAALSSPPPGPSTSTTTPATVTTHPPATFSAPLQQQTIPSPPPKIVETKPVLGGRLPDASPKSSTSSTQPQPGSLLANEYQRTEMLLAKKEESLRLEKELFAKTKEFTELQARYAAEIHHIQTKKRAADAAIAALASPSSIN